MSKILLILNDPPYGTERCYNGLRLALSLPQQREELQVSVFLIGDAVLCGKQGQKTPDGYYNVERMLRAVLRRGEVLLCGTCMEARGLTDEELIPGARRSNLQELAQRVLEAEKVLVF
jgi:uncharacterized protein involved in oxidation of intracellular sulfur